MPDFQNLSKIMPNCQRCVWLLGQAARHSLGRHVIGGSGGAQRSVVKSGESGEEHLCAEARR